jgi:hypothetical protein
MRDARKTFWNHQKTAASIVLTLSLAAAATASAETRSASTSVGIKVERHAAVFLPAPESGVAPAAFGGNQQSDLPVALGNGEPSVVLSSPASPLVKVSRGRSPERVEVTVFEP